MNPFIAQVGIVAPIMLFAATAPVRERLGHLVGDKLDGVSDTAALNHIEAATLAVVSARGPAPARRAATSPQRSRRHRS